MSDEQREDEEIEVEGHIASGEVAEDDDEDDVAAHIMRLPSARME